MKAQQEAENFANLPRMEPKSSTPYVASKETVLSKGYQQFKSNQISSKAKEKLDKARHSLQKKQASSI